MKEALPGPDTVQRLLSGLIGRNVTVKKSAPMIIGPQSKTTVAIYTSDAHSLAVLSVYDIALGASAGAALTLIPPDVAADAVKEGVLAGDMLDNLREVLNVSAALFNQDGVRHVALRAVHPPPGPLPPDVAAIVAKPAARVDMEVTIAGYGAGKMALLSSS